MSTTEHRKQYPRHRVVHLDQPRGHFTQHSDHVVNGKGFWKDVTPGQRLAWMQLRTIRTDTTWTLNGIIKVIGVDRRNFLKMFVKLEELGVAGLKDGVLSTCDPEAKNNQQPKAESQEEQPKNKEGGEKAEQPQQPNPAGVNSPAARRKPAPPVKRGPSLAANAPDLAASLAEAWNAANVRGYLREDINAGAFTKDAITLLKDLAESLEVTPQEIVNRVVSEWNPEAGGGHTPAFVFVDKNRQGLRNFFPEVLKRKAEEYRLQLRENEAVIVKAAHSGLTRAYEEHGGPEPRSLEIELREDIVSNNAAAAGSALRCFGITTNPYTVEKLAYLFASINIAKEGSKLSVWDMNFELNSRQEKQAHLLEAARQMEEEDG